MLPILVDPNLVGFFVREYEVTQQRLFEVHGAGKPLIVWAHGWLQADHMKVQLLACYNAFDEVGKLAFRSARE